MSTVDLSSLSFFDNEIHLEKLERALKINNYRLQPHQVAISTGLSLSDSFSLLTYIFHYKAAEMYLLIYHVADGHVPAKAVSIFDGFPDLPFSCPVCDKEITEDNDLEYDFIFNVEKNIIFRTD